MAGPLTAAFGDLVATERGLRPISLEGFSEDLNEDGFVDPIGQAVPVAAPLVAAPVAPLAPTTFAAPAPLAASPLAAFAAPVAPFAPTAFAAPAFTTPFAPSVLPVANPVVQAPVVKSVVETPATVAHEVHAAPLVHHLPLAPHFYTSQPAFGHVVKPFVQF